ncbi:hypothetical protein H4219_006434, partial [Mycoemilia scoparia]
YDLRVNPEHTQSTIAKLRRQRHLARWHVKEHTPLTTRSKSQRDPNLPPSGRFSLASWNINSVRGKRQELLWYLYRAKVSVLALQETLHKDDDWALRLGKYQVLSSPMCPGKPGQRGVALALAPHLIAHETGDRSPYWIWARIILPSLPQGLIVGSIYVIAHQGQERQDMLRELQKSIRKTIERNPRSPLVIMGDWNMDSQDLEALLISWNLPISLLQCRGSPVTRWKGAGRHRDLDHIVVSRDYRSYVANTWVNRHWDLSDHWPVTSFLKIRTPEQLPSQVAPSRLRLNREKVKEATPAIASHNMWKVLAEEEDTDVVVDKFLGVASEVAEATEVATSRDQAEVLANGKNLKPIIPLYTRN